MIAIKDPSLVLHSHNVPGYKYRMWATWTVPQTLLTSSLVDWIASAADRAPGGVLKNVIINTHGSPGYLHIGADVGVEHSQFFEKLRTKSIGFIWIVACTVSKGKDLGNVCAVDQRNGPYFCRELARATGCHVIAADELQSVDAAFEWISKIIPAGYIDDFEGNLYRYSPGGTRKMIKSDGSDAYE